MDIPDNPETLIYSIVADKKHLPHNRVTQEMRFRDDLAVNSMDALEILIMVEDRFSIEIPDEVSIDFATVGQLIEHVKVCCKQPHQ
ncbi:acyl carrier protein [Pseudomonas sp. Marseille-P9899]|uniref:acyl carrier protein n=1 Tax=Pseudomonas sp. Marseille-P9899 TaxID=2730401 RepID=UPI00158EAC7F|nr:phosphopantetheine-binding protein [Pseudomonas sp. Marseille-P9899]